MAKVDKILLDNKTITENENDNTIVFETKESISLEKNTEENTEETKSKKTKNVNKIINRYSNKKPIIVVNKNSKKPKKNVNHTETNHTETNHTENNLVIEYMKLLSDKQSFLLSKINENEKTTKQILNNMETTSKKHEKITSDLSNQIDDVLFLLTDPNIASDDDSCDEESYNDDDIIMINEKTFKMEDNFLKNRKKSKNGSRKNSKIMSENNRIINPQECCGVFDEINMLEQSDIVNPMQLLFDKLNGKKKKQINDDTNICSDDEYDNKASIYEENNTEIEIEGYVELDKPMTNINDLIELGEKYAYLLNDKKVDKKNKKPKDKKIETQNTIEKCKDELYELEGKKYSINLKIISKLAIPLKRLSKMIGMKKVKDDIFDMIIYYLQGFENKNNNMLHSVIEGPPGVGKTKLGKIMANIYCALEIIPSNRFTYVRATDLIGEHVGATKHMTQETIDEADGGVLFIDEAYALSSNDKDPYGKECIDTLNFNLSENKKKLIVIIAGYPDYLDKYFFSYNPGLERRFPFKFKIDSYTSEELKEIFIDKLRKFGWKFSKSVEMEKLSQFFKMNEKEFPNFGGDIENYFKSCQFAHSRRMIGKNPYQRKTLTFDDLKNGLDKFKQNKRKDDSFKSETWKNMFI